MPQLQTRYIGDIIEFELKLNVDMTGQTNSNNPGGIIVKEDLSQSANMTYVTIDIITGSFVLKFNTTGLSPGKYKLQMWWEYTDTKGLHKISTNVYDIELVQRLQGSP
ncbi:MAG: hypothetical protein KatS3mg083_097 [Candidatus Dojkabacteria bacterium]|nr:MAG: hypothetical protein KatS3mg083_097 [Candidatus Dojkabacteria bacterium]